MQFLLKLCIEATVILDKEMRNGCILDVEELDDFWNDTSVDVDVKCIDTDQISGIVMCLIKAKNAKWDIYFIISETFEGLQRPIHLSHR